MKLSDRLERIAAKAAGVTEGYAADVGTDHGFVPIRLIESGKVKHVVAMDVRKGPLERACEHVEEYHMEDQIETRLSDGLKELKPGEADTVIIAGMGGWRPCEKQCKALYSSPSVGAFCVPARTGRAGIFHCRRRDASG